MTFFDFLNAINDSKKDLLREDPHSEKEYNSFMINRGLSYFPDTILYANEMNSAAHIPKQWQFDFYRIGISKRKRFSKWHKREKDSDDIKLIMKEYNYSYQKAIQASEIINETQLQNLREKYVSGGR